MKTVVSYLANLLPRRLSPAEINEREIDRLTIERMFALDHVEYCRTEYRKAQVELDEVEKALCHRMDRASFGESQK